MKLRSLLAAIMLAAAAFSGPIGQAQAATPADQLIIGMSMANILSMDPAQSSSRESDLARINVYDTLVEIDAVDKSKLLPGVATSWSVSADRRILTLKIRDGIKFHSGNPLTGEDVVWSLRRPLLLDANGASYWRPNGFTKENAVQMIRLVDPNTVEIEIPNPTDPTLLLYTLANPITSIIDSKTAMANQKADDLGAAWLNTHEAGSGAFKLREWQSNSILILERNDAFWRGPAKLSRVVIRNMPESQTQRLMIERGDIDVAANLSGPDLKGLSSDSKDVNIQKTQEGGLYFVALSVKDKKYADPRVREAIRYLIDYKGINDTIMPDYGLFHQVPVQMGLPATLDDPGYALDVPRAKKLLADAGYPDGFETNIRALSDTPFIEIATALQSTLAQAGIKAQIISGGGSVVYDKMRDRDFEIAIGRGGGGQAPHPYSNLASMAYNPDNSDNGKLFSFQNWRASFADDKMNKMIETALVETDPVKQKQEYLDIQRRYEEVMSPIQPISQVITPVAVRADVKDLIFHPSRTTRLRDVYKAR
jgi:peptide/nickel transport system substrate-binding protein